MKLGVHAYAWYSLWQTDPLAVVDRAHQVGAELIEIPLVDTGRIDAEALKARCQERGLAVCASTLLTAETDITSPDSEVRRRGVEYLKECVRLAHQLGAPFLSGVTYGEFARPGASPPTERDWEYSAQGLREVARYAAEYGLDIAIEPVNRYESHLVNTCEQALYLREFTGEPNVKVHLDTYHMNIEENDLYDAILKAGEHLVHLHLSESHRGIPGTGQVHWDDVFRALAKLDYQGYAALESFADPAFWSATWTWRPLAPDSETLIRQGMQFIKQGLAQARM